MSAPRYAQLAGRALARAQESSPPAPPTSGARAEAIDAVADAIGARSRRRRERVWAASALAFAAVVAIVFAAPRLLTRAAPTASATAMQARYAPGATGAPGAVQVVAHQMGTGATLASAAPASADSWPLAAGSRVFAPLDGRVLLSFSTGTTALLREGADLTLASAGAVQVLRVDAGSAEFHVSKLAPAERFLVDTSDTEVEVRGTQFSVSVVTEPWCETGSRTRVAVTEGVVVVRRGGVETRVGPGEHWPVACERPSGTPPVPVSALPRAAPSSTPASTLAEQNALFASAVAARRRGDTRSALSVLDQFLVTYPASPLDESARAERVRLLRSSRSTRAEGAARDYLDRYPGGFARAEAEAVLRGIP